MYIIKNNRLKLQDIIEVGWMKRRQTDVQMNKASPIRLHFECRYTGIMADQDNTVTSTTESIYNNISSIVQEETNIPYK